MNDLVKYLMLLSLLSVTVSCAREEIPCSTNDRLYICAVSSPSSEYGNVSTKALTNGFLVNFEAGDEIGVTGVDSQGKVIDVCNNVRFVYQKDTLISGVLWSSFLNDRGYGFVERVDGARYFAYYPYSSQWDGCNLDTILGKHQVLVNQSTKENFLKSDLLSSDEPILPEDGKLNFVLNHQMATISIFYNNEWEPDGVTPKYPIIMLPGTSPSGLLTLDNTYRAPLADGQSELKHRYIVNPKVNQSVKLVGYLQETGTRFFSQTIDVQPGYLYSVSFEGEPIVPYTDGVDLGLDDVEFTDRYGEIVTLGHTVIWSKYNIGESDGETYYFDPAPGDRGQRKGSKDPYARGDYYSWGATFTQYDNGLTGYHGYGFNNYFDQEYHIAPLGGTIKETEYDVAHAKWWRGKWRLPTENEFRAMYAGCTFEKVDSYKESQNRYMGVPGTIRTFDVIKVTSKVNGNFIYLSTGGYLDGTMEAEKDEEGNYTSSGDQKLNQGIVGAQTAYYLTSSSSPQTLKCSSYAYINAGTQLINVNGSRYTGMLARPVYSPNEH